MGDRLKRIVRAYVSNDVINLQRYLTMPDAAKGKILAQYDSTEFVDYVIEHHPEILEEEPDFGYLEDSYDDPDIYPPRVFGDFYRSTWKAYMDDHDSPSFIHLEFKEWVKNQWLIHFTDYASDIARSGFVFGEDDLAHLGYTRGDGEAEKSYNFAYTIDEFSTFGSDTMGTGWKYGSECVVFRASGIEVWHDADQEPQVIFVGSTANSIVPIIEYSGEWVVKGSNGRAIYRNTNIEVVVQWVVNNYDQYRRVLN